MKTILLSAALIVLAPTVWAGEADVLNVRVSQSQEGVYRFDVTVKHADTGWDHYADAFEIVSPDGKVLGMRVLLHPHVNEQPFTRSLGGVRIADDLKSVDVRARDKVHGRGGAVMRVLLPGR